ncbi:MAG: hypothetical protein LBR68_06250 [Lachnoclostridium sp.]|nr:hypothetical protein [Lachnoclostridium sp.]
MNRVRYLICILLMQAFIISCGAENNNEITAEPEFMQEATAEPITSEMAWEASESQLAQMTLDEKVGQLFFVNLEILEPSKGIEHRYKKVTNRIREALTAYPVGGIYLSPENMKSSQQVKKMTADLNGISKKIPLYISTKMPLYISTEEAGGEKNGYSGSSLPRYPELDETKIPEEITERAERAGSQLKALGINMNFAPSANVAYDEITSFYANECFSSDEEIAADVVAASVQGMKSNGVGTVLKHFPGLGSVSGNPVAGLINIENGLTQMREVDFVPFRSGIDAGTDMVLVSHVAVTKLTQDISPSSMSPVIINDILREELGFNGVVITEAMNVPVITTHYNSGESAIQALTAGADMILMPENLGMAFQAIKQAVINQTLSMERLDEAVRQILQNKIMQGIIVMEREK